VWRRRCSSTRRARSEARAARRASSSSASGAAARAGCSSATCERPSTPALPPSLAGAARSNLPQHRLPNSRQLALALPLPRMARGVAAAQRVCRTAPSRPSLRQTEQVPAPPTDGLQQQPSEMRAEKRTSSKTRRWQAAGQERRKRLLRRLRSQRSLCTGTHTRGLPQLRRRRPRLRPRRAVPAWRIRPTLKVPPVPPRPAPRKAGPRRLLQATRRLPLRRRRRRRQQQQQQRVGWRARNWRRSLAVGRLRKGKVWSSRPCTLALAHFWCAARCTRLTVVSPAAQRRIQRARLRPGGQKRTAPAPKLFSARTGQRKRLFHVLLLLLL
jgi:hypothetical protein